MAEDQSLLSRAFRSDDCMMLKPRQEQQFSLDKARVQLLSWSPRMRRSMEDNSPDWPRELRWGSRAPAPPHVMEAATSYWRFPLPMSYPIIPKNRLIPSHT